MTALLQLQQQVIAGDDAARLVLADAYEESGLPDLAADQRDRLTLLEQIRNDKLPALKRRKRVEKMTEKETAQMAGWAQQWIAHGLSTERADRPLFEAAVKAIYRYMQMPDPRIVWTTSPIVVAFAGPIANHLLGRPGGAVRDAVRGAVGDAVGDAVRGAVGDAVRGAVGDAVGGAVDDAVDDAVRGAVGGAVRGAVGGAVGDAFGDAVRGAVGGAVDDAVGGAVDDAVDDAVRGAVGDAVGGAVGDAFGDAVRGAVRGAVGDRRTPAAQAVRNNWYRYIGGQFWPGWYWGSAYVTYMLDVLRLDIGRDLELKARAYAATIKSACWWWPHKQFVIVSERPSKIEKKPSGSLRLAQWQDWSVQP
jgi:hypothetical protein